MYEEKITDDKIIDTSASPWIRPRWVYFEAHGLRAGVDIKLTFDGKQLPVSSTGGANITNDVAGNPIIEDIQLYGRSHRSFGMKTDSQGSIRGWFYIPPKTFTSGTKTVTVSDADGSSSANANYTARGTIQTRQKTITSIRAAERREGLTVENAGPNARITITTAPATDTSESVEPADPVLALLPVDSPTSGPINYDQSSIRPGSPERTPRWVDPVAQSFMVDTDGGAFIRHLDIYVATKPGDFQNTARVINGVPLATLLGQLYPGAQLDENPKTRPMTVYIVEMENGQPTSNIVPFSMRNIDPSMLTSHPTQPILGKNTITFDDPIYLESGTQYAIIMFSSSKEYNVWTATAGAQDMYEAGSVYDGNKLVASNTNASIVGQNEDGTSFYMTRNSFRWDREGSVGLTYSLKMAQFAPSGTVVMVDSKELSDATVGGLAPEVWTPDDAHAPGVIVAYPVENLDKVDTNFTEVKFFRNATTTPNAPGTAPVDPITKVPSPEWTEVSKNAYDESRTAPNRYGFAVYPIIGDLVLNGTDIAYDHNFSTGPADGSYAEPSEWFIAKNKSPNTVAHLSNGSDLNGERVLNNPDSGSRNNYATRAHLRTNNPNVSPVLDKQQMRAAMMANLVVGVERDLLWGGKSFSQVQTTFENSGLDAAYELGKLVTGQSYSKNHVVYLADDTETFFVYAANEPKTYSGALTNDQLISSFVDDLNAGIWYKNAAFKPPFVDGATGIGNCGTYITKPITLAQPADDIKVLLDIKTPGNSYVNVSYRFQKDEPQFVYSIPYDDAVGVDLSAFIGKKVKIKYRGNAGDTEALSSTNPVTGTISNQLVVNGVEEYIVTGQPKRYRIFVSSVAEESAFSEGITFTNQEISGTKLFEAQFVDVNTIFLIPDEVTDLERIESTDPTPSIALWSAAVDYMPGELVMTADSGGAGLNNLKNTRLWRSQAYIGAEWNSATAYTTGQVVLYRTSTGTPFVAYRAISGNTNQNPATASSFWLPLLQSNGSPWPAFGIGTQPSELGTAWTIVPTIAVASALKQEESSDDWRPMVADTATNTSALDDDKYFEWSFTTKVKPEIDFTNFQVRIDMRNSGFDRVNVPSCRNLRVIAVL